MVGKEADTACRHDRVHVVVVTVAIARVLVIFVVVLVLLVNKTMSSYRKL